MAVQRVSATRCEGEMMTTVDLGELLAELERNSDRDKSDQEAVRTRKTLWEQIVQGIGRSSRDVTTELATALGVSQVTVGRWMAGTYAPRPILLDKLRTHFGVAAPSDNGAVNLLINAPVPFAGSYAALTTLTSF